MNAVGIRHSSLRPTADTPLPPHRYDHWPDGTSGNRRRGRPTAGEPASATPWRGRPRHSQHAMGSTSTRTSRALGHGSAHPSGGSRCRQRSPYACGPTARRRWTGGSGTPTSCTAPTTSCRRLGAASSRCTTAGSSITRRRDREIRKKPLSPSTRRSTSFAAAPKPTLAPTERTNDPGRRCWIRSSIAANELSASVEPPLTTRKSTRRFG